MSKSEVYSWRVDSNLKTALEDIARTEGTSVSRLLDKIVEAWLDRKQAESMEEQELQNSVREEAMQYVGSVSLDGDSHTADRVRVRMRSRLKSKRAATRSR